MLKSDIIGVVVVVIFSYLMGSLNFAIIISRIFSRDDVRKYGSGNAGMTNMLRTYGKKPAILTIVGDLLKAIIATAVSRFVIFPFFGITFMDAGYLAGLALLVGHAFPLYFGFKGGKGVITSLGVILAIDPLVFVVLLLINLPIVIKTRIVSLGSIFGAILFPVFTIISKKIRNQPFQYDLICAIIMMFIVLLLHKDNIKRLINGSENRFEKKTT